MKQRRWLWCALFLLGFPLILVAQQSGFKTFGLVSPRGYEAKLTPAGALQLTTAAPGSPTPVTPAGSPYDRFSFAYSQDPANQLQVNADGKIHVTIDGVVGGSSVWGAITGTLTDQSDLVTALGLKQNSLGYTAENATNKSTNTSLGSSDTAYPSQLAVKTYVDTGLAAKQATIGYTPENVASKSTDVALGSSNTLYSSQLAVKTYVDTADALRELLSNKSTNVALGVSDTLYPTQKATKTYVDTTVAGIIAGAGTGDITDVGSCTVGACFTGGVPGTSLTFNNATSGTVTLQTVAGALGTRTLSMPAETGTVCTTGSVCSGYQATLGNAAADGATLGKVAFIAADMNCTAGVCSIDYTNTQKATASQPGVLPAADWSRFDAKQAAGSYATLTGVETLTNKRIQPTVTTVASSTSFACNVDNGTDCSMQMTGASGTITFAAPGGTPTPMQRVLYRLKCTNAQTYAFNSVFRFSVTVTQPITCAAGKTDYIGAIYNDLVPKWDIVAVDQGH